MPMFWIYEDEALLPYKSMANENVALAWSNSQIFTMQEFSGVFTQRNIFELKMGKLLQAKCNILFYQIIQIFKWSGKKLFLRQHLSSSIMKTGAMKGEFLVAFESLRLADLNLDTFILSSA